VSCRSAKAQYWRTGFCAVESGPLRVLTVNSAFFHRSRRAADHGKISERQLAAIEDMLADLPKRRFQIGVVHHHPIVHEAFRLGTYDVIEGGTLLLDLLSEYEFDIVIHGHKHFPRLCYGTGESQSLPVFGAGSFSALLTPNIACSTRNLFHMLELDDDTMEHCGKHGVITSWEFHPGSGWLRPNNTSAALPATAGFGCHIELRSLARAVARAFRSCRIDVVRWERILILIPHLRFLVPCQLVKLAAHLRKHYGLQVAPPDQPNTIGLPHRP
jgi:hypothetical protein